MADQNDLNEEEFDLDAALAEIDEGFQESEEGTDVLEGEDGALEEDAKGATEDQQEGTETPVLENEESVDQELVLDRAPKTWRKEAAAQWDALPPTVKQEIAKREADMFKGIEGYKQGAALGQSFQQILTPYLPVLQQYGVNPFNHVAELLQAHHILALGSPEEKVALLNHMIAQFRIDPMQLVAEPAYVDPQVEALQQQVRQLQSFHQQQAYAATQQQQQMALSEVEKFSADPTKPYFNDVADIMTQLIQSGVAGNLQEAYDKAVYLHPEVREKELARLTAERREEAKKKAEEAKKATAANVKASAKNASSTTPKGSMDETIEETYKDIVSRG